MILRPRVVPEANSQCDSQDLPVQEARSSWKTQSDAQSFRETGYNIVDYRVPGISLSTVQQQNEQRQHTVAKMIEMFESHQHKEQFLQDMSQTQKIKRFSKASQKIDTGSGPDGHLGTLRILRNFNVLIGILLQKSGSLIAVAGEI